MNITNMTIAEINKALTEGRISMLQVLLAVQRYGEKECLEKRARQFHGEAITRLGG